MQPGALQVVVNSHNQAHSTILAVKGHNKLFLHVKGVQPTPCPSHLHSQKVVTLTTAPEDSTSPIMMAMLHTPEPPQNPASREPPLVQQVW